MVPILGSTPNDMAGKVKTRTAVLPIGESAGIWNGARGAFRHGKDIGNSHRPHSDIVLCDIIAVHDALIGWTYNLKESAHVWRSLLCAAIMYSQGDLALDTSQHPQFPLDGLHIWTSSNPTKLISKCKRESSQCTV